MWAYAVIPLQTRLGEGTAQGLGNFQLKQKSVCVLGGSPTFPYQQAGAVFAQATLRDLPVQPGLPKLMISYPSANLNS